MESLTEYLDGIGATLEDVSVDYGAASCSTLDEWFDEGDTLEVEDNGVVHCNGEAAGILREGDKYHPTILVTLAGLIREAEDATAKNVEGAAREDIASYVADATVPSDLNDPPEGWLSVGVNFAGRSPYLDLDDLEAVDEGAADTLWDTYIDLYNEAALAAAEEAREALRRQWAEDTRWFWRMGLPGAMVGPHCWGVCATREEAEVELDAAWEGRTPHTAPNTMLCPYRDVVEERYQDGTLIYAPLEDD